MAKLTKSLKDKFEKLSKELSKYPSFSVPDAIGVLKAKETTVRWVLWNLADQGKITRIGKGLYTLRPKFNQETQHHLSELARKVRKVLQESGFHFFISGIDILARYMVHVPEKYPVLVFVDRDVIEEADDVLETFVKKLAFEIRFQQKIVGRGEGIAPSSGELTIRKVWNGLAKAMDLDVLPPEISQEQSALIFPRPPVLCPGCPHRATFYAIR